MWKITLHLRNFMCLFIVLVRLVLRDILPKYGKLFFRYVRNLWPLNKHDIKEFLNAFINKHL